MKLQHQKHLFNIPEEVTYLNMASQSPSFKAIHEAGLKGLQKKQHPHTIKIADYFEPVKELKQLFAQLIEAEDYNRVACTPSVSYGLSNVANNIRLNPDDEIVLIAEQFPSNYYVWEKLAKKYNAKVRTVEIPETEINRPQIWNKAILEAISDKTAVVSMGNIHWSNGILFNLKTIREKTSKHSALLVIDGSQSIGALPFSVKEIKPDAVVCAGYKWLFGPYGCAYAYYGSFFDNGEPIEENWIHRLGSEDFAGLVNYQSEYNSLANRYNVGENGSFIYIGMQVEALKQVISWNPEYVQEYCKAITNDVVNELKNLGCTVENDEDRTHHLFGVKLPVSIDVNQVKSEFEKHNIFVSIRGSYLRLSCHLFNTAEDFKKLTKTLTTIINGKLRRIC